MKSGNVAIFIPHLGCPHDCSFCSQRRITGVTNVPDAAEVERIVREALEKMGPAAEKSEIAFFGGSFTAIDASLMKELLEAASPFVGEKKFRGIRVSTRPDAIDAPRLDLLRRYGVRSIELGAQSMDDRVLALNGRGHTSDDVRRASAMISKEHFELGLQMMTGLYGDTPEGARNTARELAALKPATVRIYPTITLRGTRLEELYKKGLYIPDELPQAVALCAELLGFFHQKKIPVIRLGLHASEGIENGYVAGPWHPAFRELCEGELYRAAAGKALAAVKSESVVLKVKKGCVSKLVGQKRANIELLEKKFGMRLKIRESEILPEYEVEAEATE